VGARHSRRGAIVGGTGGYLYRHRRHGRR
jgi:hypothetical protein